MTDSTQDKTRRFFFALWPDPPARTLLGGLAREVALESGGRPTLPDLIHLTLAFVGAQPAIRLDSLRRLAGLVRARSFVLALDKIGGFQRTGIAWLGSTSPQSELLALQRDLTDALRMRAFPVEDRFLITSPEYQLKRLLAAAMGDSPTPWALEIERLQAVPRRRLWEIEDEVKALLIALAPLSPIFRDSHLLL